MRSVGSTVSKSTPVEYFPSGRFRQLASADASSRILSLPEFSTHSSEIRPTVSIVICTCDRPDALRQCLQHIADLTILPDEVLVVDNSSGDEATQQVARMFGARYILEPVPGLSRARNRGLSESRSEVVAFLDDDAIPDYQWLEHLLRPFTDNRVAVVTGEIIRFAAGDLHTSGVPSGMVEIRYVTRDTPRWFEMATFGGIGIGCNMAFRKTACRGAAFFDERLGRGSPFRIAEENCAFVTVIAEGYAAIRVPEVRVYHPAKEMDVAQEATSTIAYWFLLFSKFPDNRLDLIRFLVRRLFCRRLPWRPDSQDANSIVSSSWISKLRAFVAGATLYFRERNSIPERRGSIQSRALTLI